MDKISQIAGEINSSLAKLKYWQVNNQRVYQIIKNDIRNIEIYLKQIGKLIENNMSG